MYDRILVPLDGSGLAEKALKHAKALAKDCGPAEIALLFVVEPLDTTVIEPYNDKDKEYFSQADKKVETWGKDYLAKIVKDLKSEGIAAKSIVLKGKAADNILDYAAKKGIDLIVMSTHGRSGPARWAFGSVAERVSAASTVPVLMVRVGA